MKKALSLLCVMALLFSASCSVNQNQPSTTASETQTATNTAVSETQTEKITAASVTAVNNPDIHITSLFINGQENDDSPYCLETTDTFIFNLTDTSYDKLVINAKSDVKGTTFVYDNDISDYTVGENRIKVTAVAPDKSQREITLIVGKYDENGLMAYQMYQKAKDLYWVEYYFDFDSRKTYQPKDNNEMELIQNYTDVIADNFTQLGAKQFETYMAGCFENHDGAVYGQQPQCGTDETYCGTILIEKSVSDDMMIYTAKSYYTDYNESTGKNATEPKEAVFKIVKQNGKWLIDDFTLPN